MGISQAAHRLDEGVPASCAPVVAGEMSSERLRMAGISGLGYRDDA